MAQRVNLVCLCGETKTVSRRAFMGQGMSRSLGKYVGKCVACGRMMDPTNLEEVAELPGDKAMRLAREAGTAMVEEIREERQSATDLVAALAKL